MIEKSLLTHLHYVFYDRRPSGKIVRLILGTIPPGWLAGKQTRLETREEEIISVVQFKWIGRTEMDGWINKNMGDEEFKEKGLNPPL